MNPRLTLAIVIAVVSVLTGASAQLDPLIGVAASKAVTSLCGLVGAVLASVLGVLSTQASQVGAVQSIPGTKVVVSPNAPSQLAFMAQPDSGFPNVVPEKGKEAAVTEQSKKD